MEQVIYDDGTLFVSDSRVIVEQVEYFLDDIDSIDFHVEPSYAPILLGLTAGWCAAAPSTTIRGPSAARTATGSIPTTSAGIKSFVRRRPRFDF